MARERVDWVAVLDQGRVLGWITAASLDEHERVDEIEVDAVRGRGATD